MRHRIHFHQPLISHLPHGKTDIGRLHQQQSPPEMFAHAVIVDHRGAQNSQQGAEYITPAQAMPTEQVVNQRDVQRRHYRKQQDRRHIEVKVTTEQKQVHDAKLENTHQQIQPQRFGGIAAPAQERQKHQRRQHQPEHG
ncbi:hypothetical protein BJJ98_11005 [Dickeya solani]|nr:hypothetical protein BJJ98_11005 [Dickeya solani]